MITSSSAERRGYAIGVEFGVVFYLDHLGGAPLENHRLSSETPLQATVHLSSRANIIHFHDPQSVIDPEHYSPPADTH